MAGLGAGYSAYCAALYGRAVQREASANVTRWVPPTEEEITEQRKKHVRQLADDLRDEGLVIVDQKGT
jgi:hypothetical protein